MKMKKKGEERQRMECRVNKTDIMKPAAPHLQGIPHPDKIYKAMLKEQKEEKEKLIAGDRKDR